MTEERFAYHIRQGLNRSLDELSPSVQRRLEAARHHALSHQKQEVREMVLASAGSVSLPGAGLFRSERGRQFMAILLLMVGIAICVYWQGHQYVNDIEDIDSALLTDVIPPDAFLDKGFAAWLDDSSEE